MSLRVIATIATIATIDPVAVHQMHGSRWWLTLHDYELFIRADTGLHQITIPAGYRYDRASIPTIAGIIVTKDSLGCAAPLVHDALYQCEGLPDSLARWKRCGTTIASPMALRCEPERRFTRAETDELFHAVMIADGVKPWRARLAYWAVRLFARRW